MEGFVSRIPGLVRWCRLLSASDMATDDGYSQHGSMGFWGYHLSRAERMSVPTRLQSLGFWLRFQDKKAPLSLSDWVAAMSDR